MDIGAPLRPALHRGIIMGTSYFITGTDTDVGKTLVARTLLLALGARGIRCAGYKPVSAGCTRTPEGLRNRDALLLQQAATVALPYEQVNPYAFEPPIAPISPPVSGVSIPFEGLSAGLREIEGAGADLVIVEGAGAGSCRWIISVCSRSGSPRSGCR
jgi:dethiobiotin synthetase